MTVPLLAAAVFFLLSCAQTAQAGQPEDLRAALLTRELGDPRAPGNVKLVVGLPDSFVGKRAAAVKADDFRVYVYPAEMSRDDGMRERYRARGVYMWRSGSKVFLDARVVPQQDNEGLANVRVVFAPEGGPAAEGEAEGSSRYVSDLVDVVLAVDISLSMVYNDPNKLRVAAARTFIDMARRGGGIGRVGLVTFNHEASLDTPLLPLEEGETLLKTLDGIGAEGLTNLDNPLDLALKEVRGSRNPVVILLSDGKNEGHEYVQTHLRAADSRVRIFSVGLSEHADHKLLKEMAETTGGIYFRAVKDSDLPEIYARLAAELGKRQLLQAKLLDSSQGQITYPIDASVKRLVTMIDGGARLGVKGPGAVLATTDKAMSNVYMGRPASGKWDFAWENAKPDVSVLALFGDTPLFLDVFPPQLRGDKLAVGATLGQGARALTGGQVWVEALPGVLPRRMQLFDDGQHGDGAANDGVYGALTDLPGAPEQFDLTVRASGAAWDKGEFVRQAAGLAIRSNDPPLGSAKVGGDVDFGVLFPGETGTATAHVDLEAPAPRELFLDLAWNSGDTDWPDFSSSVMVDPGKRDFELEMTVPADAKPGDYLGSFSVNDGDELGDRSTAKVRVGGVRFQTPGIVDLGVVPPGTFTSHVVGVPYFADKEAPLEVTVEGGDDLRLTHDGKTLPAGDGRLEMEAIVSAPMGRKEGEYTGKITVRAGPGTVEIPVRWRVRPYSAKVDDLEPVTGIPRPPSLGRDFSPLQQTPDFSSDFWQPRHPEPAAEPMDSPWDKVKEVFRHTPVAPESRGTPSTFRFPAGGERKSGSGFWSAWWIYILAALLLLLLLLLLLAYILYRLGKSALARFLLASAIANILLLIIFILLLSTADSISPRIVPAIAVNLVENHEPVQVELTEMEKSMIDSSSMDSAASGGNDSTALGEISFADAAPSGGQMVSEKSSRLPEGVNEGMELADARRQSRASAMSLDSDSRENTMRRRERRHERERELERESDNEVQPMPDLPEMAEPPPETGSQSGERPEVGEARLEIEAATDSDRPVWSDGDRPSQPIASEQGVLLAEAAGMEKVSMERTVARVDPRGRRRNHKELPDAYPEPRVEVADPLRESDESISAAGMENVPHEDPGVTEKRVEARALGVDAAGEKPGTLIAPGAVRLLDSELDPMPRGMSGSDAADHAAPMGGRRSRRGGSAREGTAAPSARDGLPGGSGGGQSASPNGGASGRGQQGGNAGRSGQVGEQRFDDVVGNPGGGGGGSTNGVPNSGGNSRSTTDAGDDAGDGPAPLSSGGGGGERADFTPAEGNGGNGGGLTRDTSRRGDRDGDGNGGSVPEGRDGMPGGPIGGGSGPGGVTAGRRSGDGDGDGDRQGSGGRGSGGVGEGRFDDMADAGGGSGLGSRPGDSLPGMGSARLGTGEDRYGLGIVSLPAVESEWRRNDRRGRRRTVAVAASSVDMDSLLIVVGDFARLPDSAAENLFGALTERMPSGLTIEDRRLSPDDANLSDCLLALATPDEVGDWSDAAVEKVARYLEGGGHLWLDAASMDQAGPFMDKLTKATGGEYAPLSSSHQLSEDENVRALMIGDKLAAVVTGNDWRREWRYDRKNGRTLRFFTRSLNYFLSGNADTGIVLETDAVHGDRLVQPSSDIIPDLLAGGVGGQGRLWDEFGPETASSWRMPSWSDQGRISAVSDGQGGRALRMDMGAAVKGRAAVYRSMNPPQDFSDVDHVSLDAYYDGEGEASVSMVFTVRRPGGWRDFETPPLPLVKGWNRIRFNLSDRSFRALSEGGSGGSSLPGREHTGRAGFFIYRGASSPGVALFRDIRLHGSP